MGDAAGMEGSSLAKIFVGGLDRSVDEVRLSKKNVALYLFELFLTYCFRISVNSQFIRRGKFSISNVLTKF